MMRVPMHKVVMEYEEKTRGHWFKPETMRFFRSRLPSYGYAHNDSIFFVSSENDGVRGRKYTIREFDSNTGTIETIGEFYQHTKREANRILAHDILKVKVKDL